ncbi:uncharacterized protein LOC106652073 [Trichogramma pretiosum]|uniref:uncharacterized protein LOC106652073 n=1 Tax=Trichogramma pretiosum TaxID=7493 RepID=UPI0006C9E016|nr:uncharacterized protein LOC106652073 [Trichogramma pretiosum]
MSKTCNKTAKKLNLKILMKTEKNVKSDLTLDAPVVKKVQSLDVDSLKTTPGLIEQLKDAPSTQWEIDISSCRLPYSFYNVPCQILAKNLLGKVLVRKLENGAILKGKIVETEGYLGLEDKASHTYQGKVTPRNIPMYMAPGTIYVYFTYGMYHCFNISSQEEGSAVLIRALEPLEGIELMREHRSCKPYAKVQKKLSKELKEHELCNGPSKVCMAMKLEKKHSKYSLCDWKELWIEEDPTQEEVKKIIECKRIGIDKVGQEWADKPLRYYIYDHKCVSKKDKLAESIQFP